MSDDELTDGERKAYEHGTVVRVERMLDKYFDWNPETMKYDKKEEYGIE